MRKTPLDLRPYHPGDEAAILELFRQSFGKPITLEYWLWRFQDNPFAGPMIDLAWDGDTLAAHYAVSPVIVDVAGELYMTALSMTTMTHPAYRGHGLFTTLASGLYKRLAVQEYLIVWGFPNDQSHRGFIRDLAWQDVYETPMFCIGLSSLRVVPQVSSRIVELADFDVRFDDLWKKVQLDNNNMIMVKRDSKYLRWRFGLNPHNKYRVLGYVEGGQLLGYAVFKRYQTDVDIVDIFAMRESPVAYELVLAVLDICRQNGINGVNTWLPVHHPLHVGLEKIGFRNSAPVTYLGARGLNPLPGKLDIADVRRWYYTMGDCDVF